MNKYFYIALLITSFINTDLYSQSQRFIVTKAPFSSGLDNEFSPVFIKGGIVFCSNLRDNSLISYDDEQNRLFKIVFVPRKDSTGWKQSRLFSKELTSGFNDGPATFNANGDLIYYSRNNSIANNMKNISDTSNKLGIYSAELVNGIWENVKPFAYNDPLYSFCTPSLTPDGSRIYFSSNMPGGNGKMDLYYCEMINNSWGSPINLGPVINTLKNESFPFACNYGKLFFTSDGHEGFGGKDIYYTQEINGAWITPVHLDSAINSPADDFGIVTDSTLENGFFSTNRLKTDDIFSFNTTPLEFGSCDSLQENNYCFTLYDDQHHLSDTIPVTYIWDFGDGIKRIGTEVKHCFPGPGKYLVKLSIIDKLTGKSIVEQFEYNVDLLNIEQPYINSDNFGLADKPVFFDGSKTYLKNFRTTDYLWNFGDGYKPGGPLMTYTFKKEGDYLIQLGLLGEKDSLGVLPQKCVIKKLRIFDSYQEYELKDKKDNLMFAEKPDSVWKESELLHFRIFFMDGLSERQKAQLKGKIKESEKAVLNFNAYGILPSSYQVLDNISDALKAYPDIRMEIVVHSIRNKLAGETMESSENRAQELGYYFRNKGNSAGSFHSRGAGRSPSIFKPSAAESHAIYGNVEFIFMKY